MKCYKKRYKIYALPVLLTVTIMTSVLAGCGKGNTISLSGTLESVQTDANSEVTGRILAIYKNEGDKVKKDEVIAAVDDRMQQYAVKQQEAIVRMKRLKVDELTGMKASSNAVDTAKADLDQSLAALGQAELQLGKYSIKAPSGGTLLHTNADAGDIVNTGTSIATISDLTGLYVNLYIPQKYLNSISPGQKLMLKTNALPDQPIKSEITFISGEAEFTPKNIETSEAKENTVFRFKLIIKDHIEVLKPGMTVIAGIETGR